MTNIKLSKSDNHAGGATLWISLVTLATIAMLFWCTERHGSDYYKFLRWLVCGAAIGNIWLINATLKEKKNFRIPNVFFILALAILALVFNPIIPFYMQRGTWVTIDVIAGFIFVITYLYYLTTIIIGWITHRKK